MSLSRRDLLRSGAATAGAFVIVPAFLREALAAPAGPGPSPYGDLVGPNADGLMLPPGFTSRQIATAGQPVGPSSYLLPIFPDGQATFKTNDGGWILVTNSESQAVEGGGASATRFSSDGTITDAYRILGNTARNCAGGPTPWGTWLSGEEVAAGLIWECDPAGKQAAVGRPALGAFNHEAAAVDPIGKQVYLSEDSPTGGFYRFTPNAYPDLSAGVLEIAQQIGDTITWHVVPDPTTTQSGTPTQNQVPEKTSYNGGEGLWYADGVVYFTTKGDKKVWAYTTGSRKMEVIYDYALAPAASLDQVDNVTVSASGDVLVCEDGGNLEVGLISSDRQFVAPFLRFTGAGHGTSELCGVVFSPDQKRLYVTSQRMANIAGAPLGGIFEISGPFNIPAGGIPADLVYGPPIGEPAGTPVATPTATPTSTPPSGIADTRKPGLTVEAAARIRRGRLLNKGLEVRVKVDEAATVALVFDSRAIKKPKARRPPNIVLARAKRAHEGDGSELVFRLKPNRRSRKLLRKVKGPVRARVLISARDAAGNESSAVEPVRIGRRG